MHLAPTDDSNVFVVCTVHTHTHNIIMNDIELKMYFHSCLEELEEECLYYVVFCDSLAFMIYEIVINVEGYQRSDIC